jgi:hypothetical protein
MKKIAILFFSASLFITACNKQSHGADDAVPHLPGVEDNPNGGGGNNINSAAVPGAVIAVFNARYADATRIEWKFKNGNYKVEFFRGTVKWQTIFTPAGVVVKEEHA